MAGIGMDIVTFSWEARSVFSFLWIFTFCLSNNSIRIFNKPYFPAFSFLNELMEKVYMFAFVALIMLVGIYPAILTDVIKLGISPIAGLLGG